MTYKPLRNLNFSQESRRMNKVLVSDHLRTRVYGWITAWFAGETQIKRQWCKRLVAGSYMDYQKCSNACMLWWWWCYNFCFRDCWDYMQSLPDYQATRQQVRLAVIQPGRLCVFSLFTRQTDVQAACTQSPSWPATHSKQCSTVLWKIN